jgi:hypothetical protein
MQSGINLPGMDYRNFDMAVADPAACEAACAREPQCRAWTYVRPNTVQGPAPRCWLKTGVPAAKSNPCCVSGVKGGGIGPGPTPGPGPDAWNDFNGRALIDEWLRQVESCTREVFPSSYIDNWARICGQVTTGTIDCSINPDHPFGWDSYRYLWEHNFCTQFYSIRLRDYVARRASGTPAQSLRYCKRNENGPCF